MDSIPLILEYITNQQWAVERNVLERMIEVVGRHVSGVKLTQEQIYDAVAADRSKNTNKDKVDTKYMFDSSTATAIISVSGVITKYSRMVNDVSQPKGTSVESLSEQLADAMADDNVTSILLRIESPGGSIAGLMDFADEVYQASTIKPVIAFADDQATSAAYWIGSQANEFYANRSALVGGIGVYSLVLDSSAAFDKAGFKMNIIRSGENKGVGADGIEITNKQISVLQNIVDNYYESFVAAVMRGRGIGNFSEEQLRELADGRAYVAGEAKNNNLIDGVMTLKSVIKKDRPSVRMEYTGAGQRASAESNESLNNEEYVIMDKETKVEKVDASAIADEARNSERSRITSINSALDGNAFADVRQKAIAEGKTLVEAKAAAYDVAILAAKAAEAAYSAELAVANEKLKAIAAGGSDAKATTVNDADGSDSEAGSAETFSASVKRLMVEGKTEAAAITASAKAYPAGHRAWVDTQKKY